MDHTNYQFVWFNAVKNEDVWKGILTTGTHDGMEECRLITDEREGRTRGAAGRGRRH